jgi:hypothetical protein
MKKNPTAKVSPSMKKGGIAKAKMKSGGSVAKPLKKAQDGYSMRDYGGRSTNNKDGQTNQRGRAIEAAFKQREALQKAFPDKLDKNETYVDGYNSVMKGRYVDGRHINTARGMKNAYENLAAADMADRAAKMITDAKTPSPSQRLGYSIKVHDKTKKIVGKDLTRDPDDYGSERHAKMHYTSPVRKNGGSVKSAPKMKSGGMTKSKMKMGGASKSKMK